MLEEDVPGRRKRGKLETRLMATVEHMLVINMTKEGTEDRIEWEKEKTKRNN